MRAALVSAGVLIVGAVMVSGVGGSTALAPTTAALVAVLTVAVPAMAVAQSRLLEGLNPTRLEIYRSSMVSISILCALALADGFYNLGFVEMGLTPVSDFPRLMAGVGLGVFCVAAIWGFIEVTDRVFGLREPEFVRRLLPRSPREKRAFFLLSIFAGVGEECVYRGFLLTAVALWSGSVVVALIVSSMAFALVHAYQAAPGVLRTGLLGLLLGVSVVMTNSLVPAIIAHTLIDWVMGLWLGQRILGIDPGREVL